MAEPLKNQYGRKIPEKISEMIAGVHKSFDQKAFLKDVMIGYEALELKPRGRKIAQSLRRFLPECYPKALAILVKSMGARQERNEGDAIASFLYLPHSYFIADYGLDHFDDSMLAQHALTQRFTAEFCIRPFLEKFPKQTLAVLASWSKDPSEHVRRLVSEGTRSRLPWGSHLKMFQKDPTPALILLEALKDDVSLYVRRSVANHLNDVGKDNPEILLQVAKTWQKNASEDRKWIVNHGLRSLVKAGDERALAILGFAQKARFEIKNVHFSPTKPKIGSKIRIEFGLVNKDKNSVPVLVDLKVHFVKSNGSTSPKVFKLKKLTLSPEETVSFSKIVSLENLTTRKHYPGVHRVEILVNAQTMLLGEFELK